MSGWFLFFASHIVAFVAFVSEPRVANRKDVLYPDVCLWVVFVV
jgi:hypothetical protein